MQRLKVKDQKGFTLIELLVVIAIVGILMTAVVVGIDPAARIDEAKEAKAQNNVAQVASSMEACITNSGGVVASCDTWAKLTAGGYAKSTLSDVTITAGCASATSHGTTYCKYTTATGKVACDTTVCS